MTRPRPTIAEFRAYRDAQECSMQEAVATLCAKWRLKRLADIRLNAGELYTIEQCRDVIVDLLELIQELLP
jgi:hypothetical protein